MSAVPAWIKPNKYRACMTEVDGIKFHSKKEAKRYQDLKILERAGLISKIELQVRFPLHVNEKLVCTYIADFVYLDKNGCRIVEDSKGFRTHEYRIKRKLFEAIYPLTITEV